jgi:regulator of cell morphogenesis and NO signaling
MTEPLTATAAGDDAARWPIPRLIDHIVSTHHAYVRSSLPTIAGHLAKLADADGVRHPELLRIVVYFEQVRGDLEQHLLKEERVLFPYVRDLAGQDESCGLIRSPFGTVENPIRMMEREHADAADALRIIRELTGDYGTPPDASSLYPIAMSELREFERDLERHVHLENDVLFPAAVMLERRLCGLS